MCSRRPCCSSDTRRSRTLGPPRCLDATIATQQSAATGKNHPENGDGRPARGKQGGHLIGAGSALLPQVIDGGAADVDRGEVLLHPRRDLLRRSGIAVMWTASVAHDEVPHLVVGDIALELLQRRGVVRTA